MLESLLTEEIMQNIEKTFERMFSQGKFFEYNGDLFLGVNDGVPYEESFELNAKRLSGPIEDLTFDSWADGDAINFDDMSIIETKELLSALQDENNYKQATFVIDEVDKDTENLYVKIYLEGEKIPQDAIILHFHEENGNLQFSLK